MNDTGKTPSLGSLSPYTSIRRCCSSGSIHQLDSSHDLHSSSEVNHVYV